MERTTSSGAELEFEVRGSGEPVVLIHGAHVTDAFLPLLAEPVLTERYRLVRYRRRGFADSARHSGPMSVAQQAGDCRELLRHLGIARAHVAGHSYGGIIALQLALDAPEVVHTLALLEAPLFAVPSAAQFMEAMGPVTGRYQSGDKAGAVDDFLRMVIGPDYRAALDQTVPGGFEQAVTDADTFFQVELPSLSGWTFTEEEAKRIAQPILAIVGTESSPFFHEGHELLRKWLPRSEQFRLQGATHGLQMQNPRGIAEAVASFFARHPLPITV